MKLTYDPKAQVSVAPLERTDAAGSLPRVFAFFIVLLFCVCLFGGFFVSALDTDKTVSERENRALAGRPHFSVQAVLDGSFMTDFEAYYTDTFPKRDAFLTTYHTISRLFSENRGKDDAVLVDRGDKDDFDGQDLDYEA